MKKLTTIRQIILALLLVNTLSVNLSAQQVYINEFLASNSNVNQDEYGENDDWVELYNSSSSSANIGGMFFTDDLTNTTKWMIPIGTSIPGNGFLLIWCDDQTNQGPLHTSFKLGSGGEDLALVANNGTTIIDSYTFGPQTANVSQGRQNDGSSSWVFFTEPTPDETNNSGSAQAAMPVASMNGGHYNNNITVTLTTTTSGATIRYTLDGSEPKSSSSSYNSPLQIDETTVLRARTYKSGMDASRTMTHTYLYGVDHTMPIFCISTDDDNFFGPDGIYTNWDDDIMKPAHVELYETDGSFGFRQDLGVQVHGGFSQSYPHKGLSFIAKNDYGNNTINYPLFPTLPFTEYGAFILRASGNDWSKTLFRDALASSLAREFADVDSLIKDPDLEFQAYRPAIVYLNGEYFGIHNLREKLDERYLKTHYGYEKEDVDIVQRQNTLENGNLDAWHDYRDFIEEADFTDPDDLAELKTWIDLDHFVDYFLINIFVDNNDWPDNNNKTWRLRQAGERWRYFLYDMDRGFGLIPLGGDYNSGDWTSRSLEMVMADTKTEDHNAEWSTLLIRKLMENDAFRLKFINRMADQLNIMYTPTRLLGRIDEFEAVYEPEVDQHADKWWNNNYYHTNVNRARIFAENRTEEMWNQYDDFFPIITDVVDLEIDASPHTGGVIHVNTMNFRNGDFPWQGLYFEGVDVPLKVTPNPGYIFTGWTPSSLGNNPITIMNLDGDEEVTANFSLGSTQIANIVINEINYHSPDTCDSGDWIELYNPGNQPVNISGWFLEDESGNYFNLPANTIIGGQGFLVLVEDEVRFQNVHPTVTNFIGGFGNSLTGSMGLSNGGEWISINNANRSFMDTVRYDDKLPWPEQPDGEGPTLQLISYTLDNALPTSWVPSQNTKGTPGVPNQGYLYLGENTFLCTPSTITLDATYEPCFGCMYNWSNGTTTATNDVTPSTGSNVYSVTVTDSGGTTQVDEITIDVSVPFEIAHTEQNLVCHEDNNGSIDLTIMGTGTFTYQWTNGATSQDISNLTVGTYTVTVTDALFCTRTEEVVISAPPALNESATETEINCYGELASINISVTGGAFPYTYTWSNGATTAAVTGLPEGNYAVTVTDMNGCQKVQNFSFTEPDELTGSFDIENGCNGLANGFIDVDMEGGTGDYFYEWSTGDSGTGDDLFDLDAGVYDLTVTDDAGCTWVSAAQIFASTTMFGNANVIGVNCPGNNTGSVSLAISGGSAPYSYAWNTGATTPMIQNLIVGDYMITVTDSIGCQYYETFAVMAPDSVSATATINEISCFGETDAAIIIAPSGGNGSYNFAWSDSTTTNSLSNLASGNYTLTITDGNNCSSNFAYAITEPLLLSTTALPTPIACNGDATGAVSLVATGGTGGYAYQWSNGANSADISNLAAGTYTVTVTDSHNCTTTQSAIITENTAITNTLSQTDLSCNSTPTGSISINTSGGQGTYTYLWNTNQTTAFITNLAAATYTVTVSDNLGCTSVESATLTEPVAIAANILQAGNIICFGDTDGALSASPTDGVAPYSLSWSTGDTTQQISNLAAGNYLITITDNNNCTLVETFNISTPDIISSTFLNVDNVSCNGMNNGQASISSNGGTGTLSYLWSNSATSQSISNLAPDTYSVTVSDVAGCTQVESISITEPSLLSNSYQAIDVACNNETNGSINLTTIGGTSDYTYEWNTGDSTSQISNLPGGTYVVTITDAQHCSLVESIQIINPSPVGGSINATPVSCFNGANGSIQLNASGGNAPYQFNWNTNQTGSDLSNLTVGSYTVTITDNNNCTHTVTTAITSPIAIEVNAEVAAVDCSGADNAIIDLSTTGGAGGYTYLWNTGATTPDLANLGEGNYIVTITDTNNCSIVENILVSEPSALSTQQSITHVNCFGESNGAINLTTTGGEGPYNFNWNTGQTTESIDNLVAANYTVTITDNNGCTKIQNLAIIQPDALAYNDFQLVNNNCFAESNGLITLNALGGSGNYSYTWNTGSTGNSINALTAGNYSVTIVDGHNCTFSESFVITEPSPVTIVPVVQQVNCFAELNGGIDLTISGGTGTYQTTWNTGATTPDLDNLGVGNYVVTITDANNCSIVNNFSITQPSALGTQYTTTNVQCFSESNGEINLNITGGVTPYAFDWNTGQTTSEINDLTAATYTVTVTDNNGCTDIQTMEVTQPAPIAYSNFQLINNNCFGASNGLIFLNATGGVGNYMYSWSNGVIENSVGSLVAGDYSITITDGNNCTFSESFVITESDDITVTPVIQNATCFDYQNGSIDLSISGGTGGYITNWSTGENSPSIGFLPQGTYTVTITDELACTSVESISVNHPDDIAPNGVVTPVACNGALSGSINLDVSGGTSPFQYLWDNGFTSPNPTDLGTGVYTVTITDANNCVQSQSFTMTEPALLEASFEVVDNSCFNENAGTISAEVAGGIMPYVYAWSNGDTTSVIEDLFSADYTVTITDANDCIFEESFTVEQPTMISPTAMVNNINCFGGADGTIDLSISGGTPGYEVEWSNGEIGESIDALTEGNYTAIIIDAAGCQSSNTYIINEPTLLEVAEQSVDPLDGVGGSITISPSGGSPAYSISWNTGSTNFTLNNVTAGIYNYIVTDANGCKVEGSVSLINVAVNTIASSEWAIYPNPTSGILTIESDFSEMEISVVDVLGRVLLREEHSMQTLIDLSGFGTGVYLVRVRVDGRAGVERVVVER